MLRRPLACVPCTWQHQYRATLIDLTFLDDLSNLVTWCNMVSTRFVVRWPWAINKFRQQIAKPSWHSCDGRHRLSLLCYAKGRNTKNQGARLWASCDAKNPKWRWSIQWMNMLWSRGNDWNWMNVTRCMKFIMPPEDEPLEQKCHCQGEQQISEKGLNQWWGSYSLLFGYLQIWSFTVRLPHCAACADLNTCNFMQFPDNLKAACTDRSLSEFHLHC